MQAYSGSPVVRLWMLEQLALPWGTIAAGGMVGAAVHVDRRVALTGLQSAAELNDQQGFVTGCDAAAGRFTAGLLTARGGPPSPLGLTSP